MSRVSDLVSVCIGVDWVLQLRRRLSGSCSQIHTIKRILTPLFCVVFLTACAIEGDFGRPRATAFTKWADDGIRNINIVTRGWSVPIFSREETVMREAGHRLARPFDPPVQPVHPSRISYKTQVGEYGSGHWVRTEENPLLFISREIEADHQTLSLFGSSARRVLTEDSQRLDAILRHDPGLRRGNRESARERLQSNIEFIDSVFEDFGRRLREYHYALEALREREPEIALVEIHGSLDHLRDRGASVKYELDNYAAAIFARSDAHPPRPERHGFGRFDRRHYVPSPVNPGPQPYPEPQLQAPQGLK